MLYRMLILEQKLEVIKKILREKGVECMYNCFGYESNYNRNLDKESLGKGRNYYFSIFSKDILICFEIR